MAKTLHGPIAAVSPAASPEPLLRLAQFRLLGELGRGGMGVVYRAEDESLRRVVALKVIQHTPGNDRPRERFLREARSGAAISHANVASIYEVGEADGHIYIAMELVDGESLRARMERGPLDLASARALALQVARGLGAAHARGIIHRDLKPENVMIARDGTAKLLDFGLARAVETYSAPDDPDAVTLRAVVTAQGSIVGTPAYMSPEQAFGDPLDVRSDVFSFGTMFYEMLTGSRPFSGASSAALLMSITRDPVVALRSRAPEVDEATEAIVSKCLAKTREERFNSAIEIAAALSEESAPKPGIDAGRRSRVVARIALVVGAVALLGGGGTWLARHVIAARARAESRSPNAGAQKLFDQAMLSFQHGTGHEQELLERAVQLDPEFGAARVRLLALALMTHNFSEDDGFQRAIDEHRREALMLESTLSPRDKALLDTLATDNPARMKSKTDAYLTRYPDDDMVWVLVADRGEEDRALAARPSLPQLLAAQAARLHELPHEQEAVHRLLERCLTRTPHAIDCLHERAQVLAAEGTCARSEDDVRLWLELEPDSRAAKTMLAALLVARGSSVPAVRDALGDGVPILTGVLGLPETIMPMFDGDFERVVKIASDAASRVPSARDFDHMMPVNALIQTYAEEGDVASAGRVAAEYLDRRAAWKEPCPECEAIAVGAAARAGLVTPAVAAERLTADYAAAVALGRSPAVAWASTYAASTETPDEARAAIAQLARLGIDAPAHSWTGPVGRTLFLAGRGDSARVPLEHVTRHCLHELEYTFRWAQSHMFLGQLDEQRGDRASACAHYARVIQRLGGAKPRSVTADAAKARAVALGCGS